MLCPRQGTLDICALAECLVCFVEPCSLCVLNAVMGGQQACLRFGKVLEPTVMPSYAPTPLLPAAGTKLVAAEKGGSLWTVTLFLADPTRPSTSTIEHPVAGRRSWVGCHRIALFHKSRGLHKPRCGLLVTGLGGKQQNGQARQRLGATTPAWPCAKVEICAAAGAARHHQGAVMLPVHTPQVSVALSADGLSILAAAGGPGPLWGSSDGGATWRELTCAGRRAWSSVAIAGGLQVAVERGGLVWSNTAPGNGWSECRPWGDLGRREWASVAAAPSGAAVNLAAAVAGGGPQGSWLERRVVARSVLPLGEHADREPACCVHKKHSSL